MIRSVWVLWFCFIGSVMAEPVDVITPTLFNYYTENYAPLNFIENGEVTGASVEVLKLMWQDMGVPDQKIRVMPWARSYKTTLIKPLSMLFSMVKTPEREKHFKWVGPIFTDTHVLISRSDFTGEINSVEDTFKHTVVIVRDDFSELALMKTAFPAINMIKVTDMSQALKMLDSKRSDLMFVTHEALERLVIKNGMKLSNFKRVWTISADENYYAFHHGTPDRLIKQFQQSFDNVTAQRLEILKKYGLSP
ncbi:substrate-binding periplasmic protein [Thalassotalea atypica]|uniref:substrate-binding periplasmic protein n=1 Tax=Thalassotalea atypica TaxID=2054316 RepID=UPI002573F8EC|nr:transporter substrate-binding domain-containing protein [Thalassotalea atypica]